MGGTKSDPFIHPLAAGIYPALRGRLFTGTLPEYVLFSQPFYMGAGTHGKGIRDVHEHFGFPETETHYQKNTHKGHT